MPFLAVEPFDIFRNGGVFLLLLVPLVVIHEFGHFLAAKAFGIKVLEFGIGYPPKAITYLKKGRQSTRSTGCRSAALCDCWGRGPSDPRSLAGGAGLEAAGRDVRGRIHEPGPGGCAAGGGIHGPAGD
jgi:regulator of sigma E protease